MVLLQNTSIYSAYSLGISTSTLSVINNVIRALQDGCTLSCAPSKATYITKASSLEFRAEAANFLRFTSSTLFFINKTLVVVYLFYSSFFSTNLIFSLNRKRNSIPKTTFMLLSASRRFFQKIDPYHAYFSGRN